MPGKSEEEERDPLIEGPNPDMKGGLETPSVFPVNDRNMEFLGGMSDSLVATISNVTFPFDTNSTLTVPTDHKVDPLAVLEPNLPLNSDFGSLDTATNDSSFPQDYDPLAVESGNSIGTQQPSIRTNESTTPVPSVASDDSNQQATQNTSANSDNDSSTIKMEVQIKFNQLLEYIDDEERFREHLKNLSKGALFFCGIQGTALAGSSLGSLATGNLIAAGISLTVSAVLSTGLISLSYYFGNISNVPDEKITHFLSEIRKVQEQVDQERERLMSTVPDVIEGVIVVHPTTEGQEHPLFDIGIKSEEYEKIKASSENQTAQDNQTDQENERNLVICFNYFENALSHYANKFTEIRSRRFRQQDGVELQPLSDQQERIENITEDQPREVDRQSTPQRTRRQSGQ